MRNDCTDQELIETADGLHATMCSVSSDLLGAIAEVDRRELWRDSGARDTAMWVSMRYGISYWKARRWIACAHALEDLPRISGPSPAVSWAWTRWWS